MSTSTIITISLPNFVLVLRTANGLSVEFIECVILAALKPPTDFRRRVLARSHEIETDGEDGSPGYNRLRSALS